MASPFPLLFSPIQVGKYTLRNRIVNTGHHTRYQDKKGSPTDQHVYYYRERARGGCAMIIMGAISVHATDGWEYRNVDESIVPWYQKMSDAVHQFDGVLVQQLIHWGKRIGSRERWHETYNVSASPEPFAEWDTARLAVHELSQEEIQEIVKAFGDAADRCVRGGLDGVEISMSFGNLIPQFIATGSNKRKDKYGGSLENRLRFPMEVLEEVRRRVGPNKIVGARFSEDFLDYSTRLDEVKQAVPRFVATGMMDYVNMHTGGGLQKLSGSRQAPAHYYQPGEFVYLAETIRAEVKKVNPNIPVVGIGRINNPFLAEQILREGRIDLVGMVRELIADPDLPNKAREGRADDIRRCMACNQSCIGHGYVGLAITCIYNPVTGREKEWGDLPAAPAQKKVVVVGGGPAGMEAARIAALRGHKVVLFEKSGELGGQVNLAVKTPKREDFGEIRSFFEGQLPKLGVEVRLRTEGTAAKVLAEKPDAVVIATGSTPYRPDIPGIEGKNVVSVNDVMAGAAQVGDRVVVIDTQGYRPATDVADYLAEKGKKVEIVTGLPFAGYNLPGNIWRLQYERLLRKGVVCRSFTGVAEIGEDRVATYHTVSMEPGVIEGVDTVVLATGGKANDSLYQELKGKLPEVYAVGDCWQPRDVEAAVYEGHKAARQI